MNKSLFKGSFLRRTILVALFFVVSTSFAQSTDPLNQLPSDPGGGGDAIRCGNGYCCQSNCRPGSYISPIIGCIPGAVGGCIYCDTTCYP